MYIGSWKKEELFAKNTFNYQEKAGSILERRREGSDLRDQTPAWGGTGVRRPCWGTGD